MTITHSSYSRTPADGVVECADTSEAAGIHKQKHDCLCAQHDKNVRRLNELSPIVHDAQV